MDGMSKEEWRKSMLFNCPDESALEAKLNKIKDFKQRRAESMKGNTSKGNGKVTKSKDVVIDDTTRELLTSETNATTFTSSALVLGGSTGGGGGGMDVTNRPKSWKRDEEKHKEELEAIRRAKNKQREDMRKFPDYLAPMQGKPPLPPFISDYRNAVRNGPRGQPTVNFDDAQIAKEYASKASMHALQVSQEIKALTSPSLRNDELNKDAQSKGAKLLSVDRSKLPPLEEFEVNDFVELDKSPEEWLSSNDGDEVVTGHIPFWQSGGWSWLKCAVLRYEKGKYEVQYVKPSCEEVADEGERMEGVM
jgi:hypothetical protein